MVFFSLCFCIFSYDLFFLHFFFFCFLLFFGGAHFFLVKQFKIEEHLEKGGNTIVKKKSKNRQIQRKTPETEKNNPSLPFSGSHFFCFW